MYPGPIECTLFARTMVLQVFPLDTVLLAFATRLFSPQKIGQMLGLPMTLGIEGS